MSERETWVELYRSAILELDIERLPEKIQVAGKAIEARIQALDGNNDCREERHALQDARRNLRLLERSEGTS